mgnify:CR=1 FL=1
MARKKGKKKGGEQKTKKQNIVHDPNSDHQAKKDPARILARVVQSNGLFQAESIAKNLDAEGLSGTSELEHLKTHHQETRLGGGLVWVPGPAKWMRKAMEAEERRKILEERKTRMW